MQPILHESPPNNLVNTTMCELSDHLVVLVSQDMVVVLPLKITKTATIQAETK